MKVNLFEGVRFGTFSVLSVFLSLSVQGRAAVADLNPAADAFVAAGTATNNLSANNYGGAGALAVSAVGSPKGEFQSVLRFDTSAAKSTFDSLFGVGGWSLQSVVLQLTAATPNNAIFNANAAGSFSAVWMQNDTWTEGTGTPSAPSVSGITYSSLQGTFGNPSADQGLGTFSYNGANSGTLSYTLGLSSGLVADLFAGDSVTLRLQPADGSVSYFFDSRSFGTVASRPLLSITAVPEPTTAVWLALGGLLWWTRKAGRR